MTWFRPLSKVRYDVRGTDTGIRRRGPFKLDTQNLVVGSFLPGFTPICADLKNKFAYAVINVSYGSL